jgi:hypothetical protein
VMGLSQSWCVNVSLGRISFMSFCDGFRHNLGVLMFC